MRRSTINRSRLVRDFFFFFFKNFYENKIVILENLLNSREGMICWFVCFLIKWKVSEPKEIGINKGVLVEVLTPPKFPSELISSVEI